MTNEQIDGILQAATNVAVEVHLIDTNPDSKEAIKDARLALIELGSKIQKLNRLYNECLFSENMSEELQEPE